MFQILLVFISLIFAQYLHSILHKLNITSHDMRITKNVDFIKSNNLFKGVDFSSLSFPFDVKNFEELKEGDLIYSAGQPANFIYLLIEGEVKVKLTSVKRLFFKSSNDFFGESEVLGNTVRNSSALANGDCVLYKIESTLLSKLLNDSSSLRANLLFDRKPDATINIEIATKEEPLVKESTVDINAETIKIDINQGVDIKPKNEIAIDNNNIEIPQYEHKPDLDSFLQQSYSESDNKSLKNQLIDDPDDMSNWIINEKPLDVLSTKKEMAAEHSENKFKVPDLSIVSSNPTSQTATNDEFKELIPSSDIKQISKQILEFLLHKTDSRVGAIYLFSSESQVLEEVYQTNESIEKEKKSITSGITGLAAQEKEIRFVVSFLNDVNYDQKIDRPNGFVGETLIIVPFVDDKNNILGIAQIGSSKTMFTKTEEQKLKEHSNYCSNILQQSLNIKHSTVLSSKSELNQISRFIMQDVKAPLLTIKHYSSILSRFDLSEEVKKVVNLLSSQTNSIIDLLQASIDFSEKNTKNKLEVANFDETMNHILILLSDYVESRNVKLFKKLSCDVKVKIDSRKFFVACYYISRFACDLMKQGGNLYFSSHEEDKNAVLTIRDENKFIKKNHLENIFDPDFNNDGDEKIGLSLAISKFIIESMQGTITVHLVDSGTSYLVSIPIFS